MSKDYVDPVLVRILANVARRWMRRFREAEERGDAEKVAELRERDGVESQCSPENPYSR